MVDLQRYARAMSAIFARDVIAALLVCAEAGSAVVFVVSPTRIVANASSVATVQNDAPAVAMTVKVVTHRC